MATVLRATTELVAAAWLNTLFDQPIVATTLPKPADGTPGWADTGFITVAVVGGGAGMYVPLRSPVVSVDCWAVNPQSAKPPWGKANNLAETVQAACYGPINMRLELPGGFPDVRVLSAYSVSESRRITDDQSSYAHYSLDVQLHWVEAS
ncbi:hypothetical protein [Streptomyces sp. MMBL 11-1]|uniref:hypothetical protein n=1 Tax=Streptomyces sp. MMBL 11-1 TaxID=3026420 RepID=UPI002360F2F1|nr:hypothetical protein [Streptomyces sp. MMBL 11-1]